MFTVLEDLLEMMDQESSVDTNVDMDLSEVCEHDPAWIMAHYQ